MENACDGNGVITGRLLMIRHKHQGWPEYLLDSSSEMACDVL
jgi:hypothetical protein